MNPEYMGTDVSWSPQEGHNDAEILLGTLTSGVLCHVIVVMAQDRAELSCASPRYHGHM